MYRRSPLRRSRRAMIHNAPLEEETQKLVSAHRYSVGNLEFMVAWEGGWGGGGGST